MKYSDWFFVIDLYVIPPLLLSILLCCFYISVLVEFLGFVNECLLGRAVTIYLFKLELLVLCDETNGICGVSLYPTVVD